MFVTNHLHAMAGHNSLVVGGAIVGIDVSEVLINNPYYNGFVSLSVQMSVTKNLHVDHSSGRT